MRSRPMNPKLGRQGCSLQSQAGRSLKCKEVPLHHSFERLLNGVSVLNGIRREARIDAKEIQALLHDQVVRQNSVERRLEERFAGLDLDVSDLRTDCKQRLENIDNSALVNCVEHFKGMFESSLPKFMNELDILKQCHATCARELDNSKQCLNHQNQRLADAQISIEQLGAHVKQLSEAKHKQAVMVERLDESVREFHGLANQVTGVASATNVQVMACGQHCTALDEHVTALSDHYSDLATKTDMSVRQCAELDKCVMTLLDHSTRIDKHLEINASQTARLQSCMASLMHHRSDIAKTVDVTSRQGSWHDSLALPARENSFESAVRPQTTLRISHRNVGSANCGVPEGPPCRAASPAAIRTRRNM